MCGESKSGYNVDTTYYISAAKPALFRYNGKFVLRAFLYRYLELKNWYWITNNYRKLWDKRLNEFAREWHVPWIAKWHNYAECNICKMTQRNKFNLKAASFLAPIWKSSRCIIVLISTRHSTSILVMANDSGGMETVIGVLKWSLHPAT